MKNDNLLACEIVHRIRGRIRIKSKAFKYIGASLKTEIEKYIRYYNEKRIKEKLGWLSPVQYRLSLLVA